MSNFILTGLFTEGTTDVRFLSSVVERTLQQIVFDCTGDIETQVELINIEKSGLSFNEQVLEASKVAFDKFGILILFVHTDSDSLNDETVLKHKINPVIDLLSQQDKGKYCTDLVAIVPIKMTESWMIADKELLKSEIGIDKTDFELGIHLNPETIGNPKNQIQEIIRMSKESQTKRRRNGGLQISGLYQIIGQKVDLSHLDKLSSYSKFKDALVQKLKDLNFYH